jgi:hypothetical protein
LVHINTLMLRRILEEPARLPRATEADMRILNPLIYCHVSPYCFAIIITGLLGHIRFISSWTGCSHACSPRPALCQQGRATTDAIRRATSVHVYT